MLVESRDHPAPLRVGESISLGGLAELVRGYLPDADISFEHDEGGHEASGLYLMDNSRLVEEFEVEYVPFAQRVGETINQGRRARGLPPGG